MSRNKEKNKVCKASIGGGRGTACGGRSVLLPHSFLHNPVNLGTNPIKKPPPVGASACAVPCAEGDRLRWKERFHFTFHRNAGTCHPEAPPKDLVMIRTNPIFPHRLKTRSLSAQGDTSCHFTFLPRSLPCASGRWLAKQDGRVVNSAFPHRLKTHSLSAQGDTSCHFAFPQSLHRWRELTPKKTTK